MNEQISLFDNFDCDNYKLRFYGNYCNDDWSCKTKKVGNIPNIVDCIAFELTKAELKDICRKALLIVPCRPYGYDVRFEMEGIKQEIFVRFVNYTIRKNRTVFEHIDLYFEK